MNMETILENSKNMTPYAFIAMLNDNGIKWHFDFVKSQDTLYVVVDNTTISKPLYFGLF